VKRTVVLVACLLATACIARNAGAKTALIDRIVAVVNGEIITLSQLEEFKKLMYMGQPQKPAGADVDRNLLNQLIEKKVIIQEAKNLEIEVTRKDVDGALEEIVKRNKITLKQMEEYLIKEGSTLEEYREVLKEEIIHSQAVGRQVTAKITMTDQEIQQYYDDVIKPKEKPGARVRIQQILLMIPKDSTPEKTAAMEKTAAEIREKITGGAQFAKMAADYSQGPAAKIGGDLGYFHKGELLPSIEKAAFSMETGQLSPVIRTAVGFHLIKVLDKDTNEGDRSWKDHEDEIKDALYRRKFEKQFGEWMKKLKGKSYIEINL